MIDLSCSALFSTTTGSTIAISTMKHRENFWEQHTITEMKSRSLDPMLQWAMHHDQHDQ